MYSFVLFFLILCGGAYIWFICGIFFILAGGSLGISSYYEKKIKELPYPFNSDTSKYHFSTFSLLGPLHLFIFLYYFILFIRRKLKGVKQPKEIENHTPYPLCKSCSYLFSLPRHRGSIKYCPYHPILETNLLFEDFGKKCTNYRNKEIERQKKQEQTVKELNNNSSNTWQPIPQTNPTNRTKRKLTI